MKRGSEGDRGGRITKNKKKKENRVSKYIDTKKIVKSDEHKKRSNRSNIKYSHRYTPNTQENHI